MTVGAPDANGSPGHGFHCGSKCFGDLPRLTPARIENWQARAIDALAFFAWVDFEIPMDSPKQEA
jgi:hypothetical protein